MDPTRKCWARVAVLLFLSRHVAYLTTGNSNIRRTQVKKLKLRRN